MTCSIGSTAIVDRRRRLGHDGAWQRVSEVGWLVGGWLGALGMQLPHIRLHMSRVCFPLHSTSLACCLNGWSGVAGRLGSGEAGNGGAAVASWPLID